MCKGFLKEAAKTVKLARGAANYDHFLKDKVTRFAYILPNKIRLPRIDTENLDPEHKDNVPEGHNFPVLERPLRADTPLGKRVTLARSDYIPAGTRFSFELHVLGHCQGEGLSDELIRDLLEFAQYTGFGQWRSGGFGAAIVVECEKIRDDGGDEKAPAPVKRPYTRKKKTAEETPDPVKRTSTRKKKTAEETPAVAEEVPAAPAAEASPAASDEEAA
jgi:hypothetical protein